MSGQTLYLTDRIRGLLTEIDRDDDKSCRHLSDALVACNAELDAYREDYEAAVEIIANHLEGRGNTDRAIAMIERAVRVRKGLVEEAAP